jgi:hypothetical protein
MAGSLALWFMLLPGPADPGTGYTDPSEPALWLARNAPPWLREEVKASAGRMGLFGWAVEGERWGFDDFVTMVYRRHHGPPWPYPWDPFGPGTPYWSRQ